MSTTNRKGPVFDPGLCRCCGCVKKCRVLNVEYEFQGQKEVYSDMFMDCFGLMLLDLDGTNEKERLICASCVVRLRDALSFRMQVLRCEEKLLKANIHVHQTNEYINCTIETKVEAIKKEITEPEEVFVEVEVSNDVDKVSDAKRMITETQGKVLMQSNTATPNNSESDIVIRMQQLTEKLKMKEREELEPPKSVVKPTDPGETFGLSPQQLHNCSTIVENSYVCPFDTSFSDYHCVYCRQKFSDPEELRAHTLTHDPRRYKKIVTRNRRLAQVDITRIDCRLCDQKINDLEIFKTHLTTNHGKHFFPNVENEVLQFKLTLSHLACLACESAFGCFRVLRNHMASHFGTCVCDVCGAHFFEERALYKHQRIHKKKPNEAQQCKDCGKEFTTKKGLYIHTTTTHKKKAIHQCGKCEEVFFSYALKCRHRIEVHGEKRYFACEHCDKSFNNRKSWKDHMQNVHLKTKMSIPKHKCDVCDRLFRLPYQLKEHMTVHTGERNFRCEFCGKSYPRLKALKLHMKSHSDNKYRCTVCDATFTQNVSLKNHLKKQHSNFETDNLNK